MKFQLIIPMSGIGKRFLDVGYKIPKPLIKVKGKEIIKHVIDMFEEIDNVIFICNENHINDKKLNLKQLLKSLHPNSQVISIKEHKKGPIHAVLEAESKINLKMPTIVNYCDFNSIFKFSEFKKFFVKENSDGIIFTYTGFHPHMLKNTNYAYVKKNGGNLIDIQEKKPFTEQPMEEEVSSGTYFFKTAEVMLNYFKKTIELDLNVKGEYYVSMSYKPMIQECLKINTFLIDYFMQWGTPEDLDEFNWHSSIFDKLLVKKNKNSKNSKGCLLLPMAGYGSRFTKKGYKIPKPLIKVSGEEMFIKAIKDLPKMKSLKIITRKEIVKDNNCFEDIKNFYDDVEVKILNKMTDGQAITCLEGLHDNHFDDSQSLLISACDMGVIFDQGKYEELFNSEDIDVLVWGCQGYPGAIKNPSMYSWIYKKNQYISKVSVKENLSNPKEDYLLIGTFTFKKAYDFLKSARLNIAENNTVNGEFYVDDVINKSIEIGLKVALFEVDHFICWGTPDELSTYNYWEKCFNEWSYHPFKKIT